jgi:hypothetical protein
MITITKDKAAEIIDIINDLVGMMEPYYAQSVTSTVSAYRLIDELELHLPYIEEILPTNECSICGKTIFTHSAYRQHMKAAHKITNITNKQIDVVVKVGGKKWETKQLYLDSLESNNY